MRVDDLRDRSVDEACWWLTRWVSGSMRDPDWDDSWTSLTIADAFEILQQAVGNAHSAGRPIWRSLRVDQRKAQRILSSGVLDPNPVSEFQSFSRSKSEAAAFAEDGAGRGTGSYVLLVSAQPSASDVMFGMADLRRSTIPAVRQAVRELADWVHQDEVIVRVARQMPLLTVARLGRDVASARPSKG